MLGDNYMPLPTQSIDTGGFRQKNADLEAEKDTATQRLTAPGDLLLIVMMKTDEL